jgi:uncharacterized membrane protein YhaH (DUF805 family)
MLYIQHVFANIFNYRDRANRAEFWCWFIASAIVTIILLVIIYIAFQKIGQGMPKRDLPGLTAFMGLINLTLLHCVCLLSYALIARRLHDIGLRESLIFFAIFPVINMVFILIIGLIPGKNLPNNYGDKAWVPESDGS